MVIYPPMAYPTLWTPQVKSAFLTALTEGGEIIAACQAVNLSTQGAYRHRSLDPEFARAWDVARHHAKEVVFDRLTSRALDGWSENVYYRGELIGTRQRHDNRLILALIARLDKITPPTPTAPANLRAADTFAALLDDLANDQPLDPHFAPTRKEREAIMIARVQGRATYNHYADLMTLEEQEWVNGGPLCEFDDEEEWDGEEDEDEQRDSQRDAAAPDHPVAPAPEPGPLSGDHTPAPHSQDDQNPAHVSPPGGHHSSSLLNETTASSPSGEGADRQARRNAEASWQADLAIIEQARKARFGEMSVHIEQPNGGPRIRLL